MMVNMIIDDFINSLGVFDIEDFLGMSVEEFIEYADPFKVSAAIFPKEKDTEREVVKFHTSDMEDAKSILRIFKLLEEAEESELVLGETEFGDDVSIAIKFNEHKYYKVCSNQKCSCIWVEAVTSSVPVDELDFEMYAAAY